MSNDAREAAAKWLKEQGVVDAVTSTELTDLRELIGSNAFGLFYGMMQWDRQAAASALSLVNLGSAEGVARAAVLQGQIRAIDAIRESLLDIADPPSDDTAQQAMEQEI